MQEGLTCQYDQFQLQFYRQQPLTFQDSLTQVPNYPFCTLGVLTAEGKWGIRKGIAFVVEDNYLLTCASNCYSHQHGKYHNITFTINSNRKHGNDTYKIAKTYIQQFRTLSQNQRNKCNYALLYIEGEPNLKDKYGNITFFERHPFQKAQTYFECQLNEGKRLQFVAEHIVNNNIIFSFDGVPLILGNKLSGLIYESQDVLKPEVIRFTSQIYAHIAQWARYHRKVKVRSVANEIKTKVNRRLVSYQNQGQQYNWQSLNDFDFGFLRKDKYKNLKFLSLIQLIIDPKVCDLIAKAVLPNLISLSLCYNRAIGNEGCKYLASANWPFLQFLGLDFCGIGNQGLSYLAKSHFKNLNTLGISENLIGGEVAGIFDQAEFPRIRYLDFHVNKLIGLDMQFVRKKGWQQLNSLDLDNNPVGNHGCKMIRQAGFVLECLNVNQCQINIIGMKWLFKMNMRKLYELGISRNIMGNQGCSYFSKASFLAYKQQDIDVVLSDKSMRLLFKTEWADQTLSQRIKRYKDYLHSTSNPRVY